MASDPSWLSLLAKHIRSHFPAWKEVEEVRETITELYFFAMQGVSFSLLASPRQLKIKRLFALLVRTAMSEYNQATAGLNKGKRK